MMAIFIYASTHTFIYRRRVVNDGTKAFIESIHIEFFYDMNIYKSKMMAVDGKFNK